MSTLFTTPTVKTGGGYEWPYHYIIEISTFYHDSAACLVKDGEIVVYGGQRWN